MTINRYCAAVFAACIYSMAIAATDITSPDGRIAVSISLNGEGVPTYNMTLEGRTVIGDSPLGFELSDTASLASGFKVIDEQRAAVDETWSPVWGEESEIRSHYNELLLSLEQQSTGRIMNLRFRVFDDGAGFRYEFPLNQKNLDYFVISDELTGFAIPTDATAYWIPGDYDSQEFNYTKCRLSEIASHYDSSHEGGPLYPSPFSKTGVQTALQLKYDDGLYVNIHEAALYDYPAMCLVLNDSTRVLTAALTPYGNSDKALMHTGMNTPWRTIIASDDARDILASRITLNLNEPCRIDDTSWIHPVKYMGVWWEMIAGRSSWAYTDEAPVVEIGKTDYSQLKPNGRQGANTANVMRYIDFAAQHGFDGVLVEGWNEGWEDNAMPKVTKFSFTKAYPDFDVEKIRDYAASKGIKMVMHHETGSAVTDYERQLEDAFQFMNDNGYEAVKGGYIYDLVPRGEHHYGQQMVNHYQHVVEQAARHKILYNAHEAVRPTGICRTWPNLVSNESARGSEYHAFSGITPGHTCILPFTRLIGGPMDYTPGLFENNISRYNPYSKAWVNTTLANQLALYVTMSSPLQMAADLPETYERYMDAFQFIKDVALDWDKSVYLEAEPMEYVTVARKEKGGDRWFVGSTAGETPRTSKIDFSFLPAKRKYRATIYRDGKNAHYRTAPQDYVIETKTIDNRTKLTIPVASSGGYAIMLTPLD